MKKKGFTLVELLVVVAILGVLAAVGIVAFGGYTSAAKKAAAEALESKLQTADSIYRTSWPLPLKKHPR